MNLPKAREKLKDHRAFLFKSPNPDLIVAVQLGIEAINAVQTHRTLGYPGLNFLLPSETKE